MIGTLDPRHKEVTIVGAGISGLLAAYYLDRAGYEVTLLEEKNRVGGLISTSRTEYGIAESAAHSLLADGTVLRLFQDLGVEWEEVRKNARARFILRDGKMRRFPLTFFETLATLWRAFRPARGITPEPGHSSLTLEQWGMRYLGRPATRYLLGPFARGIYGCEPAEISVSAAFPALLIPPGKSLASFLLARSLKGPRARPAEGRKMIVPRHGMVDLVRKLEQRLESRLGSRFRKNAPVRTLAGAPGNLVLTVPADRAADLLAEEDPGLSASLRNVKYTPLVSVTAFVSGKDVPESVRGVGVLVPATEQRECLGVLFNSSSFAGRVTDPGKWMSFTLMLGGPSRSETEIASIVAAELSAVLGIQGAPVFQQIHRWPRALPRYSPRLEALWREARAGWASRPGRILFGNYAGQVSLRGMVASAAKLPAFTGGSQERT